MFYQFVVLWSSRNPRSTCLLPVCCLVLTGVLSVLLCPNRGLQGGMRKNWLERWFVLDLNCGTIAYYTDMKLSQMKGGVSAPPDRRPLAPPAPTPFNRAPAVPLI